ncbi:hypothetical protein D3C87_1798140 [compost metagenome]
MPRHVAVQIEVRANQVVESVASGRSLLRDTSQCRQQLFVEFFDEVQQQVLFARVMVIQRARGKPQARRKLTHADLTEALAGEQFQHLVAVFGETRATLRHRHESHAPFCVPGNRRPPFP